MPVTPARNVSVNVIDVTQVQGPTGSGTVTSVDVSGGTTGLTTSGGPISGSGVITIAGTLGLANGGTGTTSALTAGYIKSTGVAYTSQVVPIPIADGGTNLTTIPANGAVIFTAVGGYAGDNTKLAWNNGTVALALGGSLGTQESLLTLKGPGGASGNQLVVASSDYNPGVAGSAVYFGQSSPGTGNVSSYITAVNAGGAGNGSIVLNNQGGTVDIGTNASGTALRAYGSATVYGALATTSQSVTLANGLNSNITPPATSFARVSGPTGAFSVGGFSGGADGRKLTLFNPTSQTMTIVNEDASSSGVNRITTLTGANVALLAGSPSIVELVYDVGTTRWLLNDIGTGTGFIKQDGTLPLSANWNAGNYSILSRNSGDVFNVKAYGALGNSTNGIDGHDDTTAINQAISDASVKGGTVFFPLGFYRIQSKLVIAASVRGVSFKGAQGSYAAGGTSIGSTIVADPTFWDVGTSPVMLPFLNNQYIEVSNLCFDGGLVTGLTGISIDGNGSQPAGYFDFHDLSIRRTFIGMWLGNSSNETDSISVTNCAFFEGNPIRASSAIYLNSRLLGQVTFKNVYTIGWRFSYNINNCGPITIDNCNGGNPTTDSHDFVYLSGYFGDISVINSQEETTGGTLNALNVTAGAIGDANSAVSFYSCNVSAAVIASYCRVTTTQCSFNGGDWVYSNVASNHVSINDIFWGHGVINVGASGTKVSYVTPGAISVGAAPSARQADFYLPAGNTRVRVTADAGSSPGYEIINTGSNQWTMYAQAANYLIFGESGVGAHFAIQPGAATSLLWYPAGQATSIPGIIFTQTANKTTTANSLTSLFATGLGTLTLPANLLIVGRTIRLRLSGYISAADGGAATHTLTLLLGGVSVATGTTGATFTSVLNAGWTATAEITCRSTGAPGTVIGTATWLTEIATATPDGIVAGPTSQTTASVTTTGTLAVDLQFNNGNATGTITTTNASVEILN